MLAGFGNGLEDGGWNAWIGNMESANELLGFLHGAYGLGATISPLIATVNNPYAFRVVFFSKSFRTLSFQG